MSRPDSAESHLHIPNAISPHRGSSMLNPSHHTPSLAASSRHSLSPGLNHFTELLAPAPATVRCSKPASHLMRPPGGCLGECPHTGIAGRPCTSPVTLPWLLGGTLCLRCGESSSWAVGKPGFTPSRHQCLVLPEDHYTLHIPGEVSLFHGRGLPL
jgi:hypothetical protein